MAIEALAAALLALAVLALVLQPLLKPHSGAETIEPLDLEETPKGVALAALKEIEFDRETGKLSNADYELLKTRYTAAALEALRDERVAAASDIEALIQAKVRSLRSASAPTSQHDSESSSVHTESVRATCNSCGPRSEPDAVFCSSCGRPLGSRAACDRCGARLSPDSRYCDRCGQPVAA